MRGYWFLSFTDERYNNPDDPEHPHFLGLVIVPSRRNNDQGFQLACMSVENLRLVSGKGTVQGTFIQVDTDPPQNTILRLIPTHAEAEKIEREWAELAFESGERPGDYS